MLKKQNYGIKIEMTGLTREAAAKALANYFGTNPRYKGGVYGTWEVPDAQGKTWKLVSDASIHQEKKTGRGKYEKVYHGKDYSVEMVSPVLTYEELPKLQEAVRQVRHAGAKVNGSCGIHIHIDGANHTAKSLRNVLGIMYAKEDLLFKALQVQESRVHYCKKSRLDILTEARAEKNLTMDRIGEIWYRTKDWQPHAHQHYDDSRYHALNLHAMFSKGTVEFRLFNSTLHAGEIKAYVNLCLAISAQAIRQKSTQLTKTTSDNEKFTFRTWLLRLGLNGDEFKTTRDHLLKHLDGNAAWRYAPENYPTHPHTIAANAAAALA